MTAGWAIWFEFFLCLGLIGVSGSQLSRYGDVLAEKTGLGQTWLGLVVLAFITSLPEAATGFSAILWVNAPDITVGNLLGSCVLNLLFLALMDLMFPPGPVLTVADRGHVLAASFGVIMLGVTIMGILSPSALRVPGTYIGFNALLLLLCYLVAMRAIFRYQRRERRAFLAEHKENLKYEALGLSPTLVKFGIHALVVVIVGVFLPKVAKDLALFMGWTQSLVGTLFVAATTTLPEVVVTFSALRLGAVDMAVGNLLGSNLVNLALLGGMELLSREGPMWERVSPQHATTAVMAIVMTGIASAEMTYRPQKKTLRWLSLGTFLLAFLYVVHVFLQLQMR